MQMVVGPQQILLGALLDRADHRVPGATAQAVGVGIAHAQCVKHGGDARGGHFGVVCDQSGHLGPLHFGPGHQVALKVVGVHLDKAGHEVVALQVPALRVRRRALVHRMDAALVNRHAALHHLGGQDQVGVFEDG